MLSNYQSSYKLREIACNLCGANDCAPVTKEGDFSICRCRRCGLLYVNPQPYDWSTAESLGSFDYYEDESKLDEMASKHIPAFESGLDILDKLRPSLPGTKLLDVGCGVGTFLGLAKDRGWELNGQDISAKACEQTKQVVEAERVFCSTLEAMDNQGSFDMATLWFMLEHVEDPTSILRAIAGLLKPGGDILIRIPNIGTLQHFRWRLDQMRGQQKLSLLGGVPAHLYGYTPRTIKRYLHKCGFWKVRFWATQPVSHVSRSARLLANLSQVSVALTGGGSTLGPILVTAKRKTEKKQSP